MRNAGKEVCPIVNDVDDIRRTAQANAEDMAMPHGGNGAAI